MSTKDIMITGSPVASAKTDGMIIPSENFSARGISIPKNRTAENGQNARANRIPSRNAPR